MHPPQCGEGTVVATGFVSADADRDLTWGSL